MPKITFYEQDADRQTVPLKVDSIETPEELRRYQAEATRLENVDTEDPDTRKDLFKNLLKDPDFAEASTELRSLRMDMTGKWGKEERELDLRMKREVIADLLQDPEMAGQREELRQILKELPNMQVEEEELGEAELREEMKELEAISDGPLVEGISDEALIGELGKIDKELDDRELKKEFEEFETEHKGQAEDMLRELTAYEKSKGFKPKAGEDYGGDSTSGREIANFSGEDHSSTSVESTAASGSSNVERASIDTDPNAILTIEERIELAQRDPEHRAALHRLALRPESDPAIKHLNAVLRTAYMGANEDVRKALWRAYSRAKRVPRFLEMIPNDAWDMLWYSQAVKWKGNQNREEHMAVLRKDLESLGMDGPPTPEEALE
jgi:hypothetical protein